MANASDLDPAALRTTATVARRLREALGANLAAVYLHGSAVLGGFDPSVSDLDVLVVCDAPLSDGEVQAVVRGVEGLDLPAKGLEMSILTRSEARSPEFERPRYQLHVAAPSAGPARVVDGRIEEGDRDLILHFAVCRQSGHAHFGPPPGELLAEPPVEVVRQSMINEIAWARDNADPVYLTLTAARAEAFARTGRHLSKVAAGEAAGAIPVVCAAVARQRGEEVELDPAEARRYADDVEAVLDGDDAMLPLPPVWRS